MIAITRRKGKNDKLTVSAVVDDDTRVIWVNKQKTFILQFKPKGAAKNEWHYQWLSWKCRAGQRQLFPAVVALYRYLRRNGIVQDKLRYLATGFSFKD